MSPSGILLGVLHAFTAPIMLFLLFFFKSLKVIDSMFFFFLFSFFFVPRQQSESNHFEFFSSSPHNLVFRVPCPGVDEFVNGVAGASLEESTRIHMIGCGFKKFRWFSLVSPQRLNFCPGSSGSKPKRVYSFAEWPLGTDIEAC